MNKKNKVMELINKDALVAEIERLISNGQVKLQESQESNDDESYVAWSEHIATCIRILSFINTLEVKEVDLEKEIDNIWNPRFNLGWDEKSLLSMNYEGFATVAKHFFELGLKSREGQNSEHIEYIRKDVFIDKASEWLCNNYDKYIRAIGGSIYPAYLDLCRDFKNYMKGE